MSAHQPRPYEARRVAATGSELARKYQLSGKVAARAMHTGLTLAQADRIATIEQTHIDVLWPELAGYLPPVPLARSNVPNHHVVALVVDGGYGIDGAADVLGLSDTYVERVMAGARR